MKKIYYFENQVLSTEEQSIQVTKHLLGMAMFIKWANTVPEYNVNFAAQNERVLSPYLSSFFSISKDDSQSTLYVGVQEREARWLKFLPFYAANIDREKSNLTFLCDSSTFAGRRFQPINITIQINSHWKIYQLVQLRRLVFVGVRAENGDIVEVFDYSKESLRLYHQTLSVTIMQLSIEKNQKQSSIYNLF